MGFVMEYYVYVHKRNTDGKIFYVGKGCGKRAWKKSCRNQWWKNIEKKHGRTVEIVARKLSESEAFSMEQQLIASIGRDNLCNMTDGGEGGVSPTKETREKISKANKGKVVSAETRRRKMIAATGRKHSDETKEKIRIARSRQVMKPMSDGTREILRKINTGKVVPPEVGRKISESKKGKKIGPMPEWHKEKIRLSNLGKRHTDEAKKKVSMANSGRKHTDQAMEKIFASNRKTNAEKRKAIKCSNGIVFESSYQAENWLRCNGFQKASRSNVVSCCTGNLRSAYGPLWCYNCE